jgi:hypothetical protein
VEPDAPPRGRHRAPAADRACLSAGLMLNTAAIPPSTLIRAAWQSCNIRSYGDMIGPGASGSPGLPNLSEAQAPVSLPKTAHSGHMRSLPRHLCRGRNDRLIERVRRNPDPT